MTDEETKTELKGPLPEDFPGRAALAEAGITSYGKLRRYKGELTEIDGIGAATAEKIKAAQGEAHSSDEESTAAPAEAVAESAPAESDASEEEPVGETGAQKTARLQRAAGVEGSPI